MLTGNWSINYTFEDRYEITGITDFILDYAKNSKNKLIILDVGCSIGTAMKYAQDYLKQKNVESFTVGIDVSKYVVEKASKNLDKFINEDLFNVDDFVGKADVVICSKMAIFVTGETRHKIIKKCTDFLNDKGILITDVDCFEKPKLSDDLNDFLCGFPTWSCFKNGIGGFRKEFRRRLNIPYKKKMKKMHKDEALKYAEEILLAWNDFSFFKKLDWKLSINQRWIISSVISGNLSKFLRAKLTS
jgi:SAM-dependent methyltransferase